MKYVLFSLALIATGCEADSRDLLLPPSASPDAGIECAGAAPASRAPRLRTTPGVLRLASRSFVLAPRDRQETIRSQRFTLALGAPVDPPACRAEMEAR